MKLPFDQYHLGFYPVDDAGRYIGVNPRTLRYWLEKGSADEKHVNKLKELQEFYLFPIDVPPFCPRTISYTAHNAFQALCNGEPEIAELRSSRALRIKRDSTWDEGLEYELTPLQEIYCLLVNSLAWQRHHKAECRAKGRGLLKKLFKEINNRRKSSTTKGIKEHTWEYAYLMTSSRVLTYSSIKNLETIRSKRKYRLIYKKMFQDMQSRVEIFPKSYLRGLVAWNTIQIAAIDKDIPLFITSLEILTSVYGSHMKVIMNMLINDGDTGPMLKLDRIEKHFNIFDNFQSMSKE